MRRLYVRIYLHFLVILVVVWLTTFFFVFHGARNAIIREFPGRIAFHVANEVAPVFEDPVARQEALRKVADDLALDATVRSVDGSLLAAAGDELAPAEPAELRAAEEGPVLSHGRGHLVMVALIHDPKTGRVLGYVTGAHHGDLHLHWPFRNVLAFLLVLGVVGVAAFPLARRISRPVERLTEASRRLGAGELSYRIAEERAFRRSELGELVHVWNEMAARIERQVQAQKELLANVSHELRSPLARIRVALEMLPQDPRLADVLEDLVELDRLIEDTLTAARLDAQALPLRRSTVRVDDLFGSIAERARVDPLTQGKEVSAAPTGLTVEADGALLKRALWNLVENAAKYGAPPVRLIASREDGRTTLVVEDQGAGIAEVDLPRVFEPFYRADKAHTPMHGAMQGFGLGLTLARRIAEAHGGTIRAEAARPGSRPPGCRMVMTLPSAAAAAPASPD